jgi:hypothetical protein
VNPYGTFELDTKERPVARELLVTWVQRERGVAAAQGNDLWLPGSVVPQRLPAVSNRASRARLPGGMGLILPASARKITATPRYSARMSLLPLDGDYEPPKDHHRGPSSDAG